jgi:GH24 family phage-related lysozyme (muramidase)
MNSETIDHLIRRLKWQEEGNKVSLKPYQCSKKKWTIGWGHNYQENPLLPDIKAYLDQTGSILPEMADRQFLHDVNDAIADARKHCPNFDKFSEVRQAVFVNMVFNMGAGCMHWPNLRKALAAMDIESICREMKDSAWYRELGGDPEGTDDGILERPEEQIAMMKTDQWQK